MTHEPWVRVRMEDHLSNWPPPQQPRYGPPYGMYGMPPAPPAPKNGVGTAGFVLGLAAAWLAWIPIVGIIGWPLSIAGIVLSAIGLSHVAKGRATNRALPAVGLVFSVIALVICILWAAFFGYAVQRGGAVTPGATVPSASAKSENGDARTALLGQTLTLDDGLSIGTSQPSEYHPSSYAFGGNGARTFAITVTVTNGSQQQVQFNTFEWTPQVTHDGQLAAQVFDTTLDDLGVSTLLPGKSLSFTVAFSVGAAPGDLQVEFRPIGRRHAVFTGTF